MMISNLSINENLPWGATELNFEELEGLIPAYITKRGELDEFEKANITKAITWLRKKNYNYETILTLKLVFELHTRMFNKTWLWAGQLRQRAVNIGNTPTEQIQMRVKNILDNVKYWIDNQTYPMDEICIRLHHQLVWVHPFPNGNGRFSRIICDELRRCLGFGYFSWGNTNGSLISPDKNRRIYIEALRAADSKNYGPLLSFANS
ncbi:MAG: mobile mystery protein B [Burkholderiales bacterium]|nr:mobile mystery protein B [Burkholderiales bacterium]